MAGFNDAAGNMAFLKSKFNKNIAAGEKSMATEFEMTIEEYPEVAVRVRSTQIPGMGRADVEDFGPMGLGITQQGPLENKGEIAVTCVETLQGPIIGMLREVVRDKKYLTVKIQMTPESLEGKAPDAHKFRLLHCKLRSDPVDLSTEDTAALVKPAFTITYNWVEL